MTNKSIKFRFGNKLRQLRKEKSLSQEEAAARSQLERSYYGRIERGEANPSLEAINRIAKAFGTKLKELIP